MLSSHREAEPSTQNRDSATDGNSDHKEPDAGHDQPLNTQVSFLVKPNNMKNFNILKTIPLEESSLDVLRALGNSLPVSYSTTLMTSSIHY